MRESSTLTKLGGLCAVSHACLGQVHTLRNLKHSKVIEIYQFFNDDPSNYYVVIEFMEGDELFERIVKKVWFSEGHAER